VPGERKALIGRTLGHYRIVDRLGSGGMGVVWLAEDLKLRRRVALKMLREDLAGSADKASRFDREAKAIAALSHPNIVTIHAIEEIDGVRFLAMEYLEGQTLADLIPADGFPLPELLRLAVPVAEALAAAHARGITHRDLKPSNIFVTTEGRVKVLDFGLAKLQGGDVTQIYGRELETTLTQEGTVVGTLHYMSPEQLQLKHVDHRSDLYSLGVVLWEMATGDLPFRGESAAQVISSVLRDRPRRLDDVDARMPPEIADLVASCLEKDVNKRLASAAEARDRLSAVARALETGALSLASSRLRRLVGGPNRGRVRALAAGVAALAVAVVAIPWALRELRDSKSADRRETGEVAEARIPSIAVLPFANYSGDPDYFVDGMTDGVIGALGRLGGVRVISRQSAMHYKNSTKKLPEIAEELGVDFLIEGSVARESDTIRLQARLVRPKPEEQVWAEAYDRASGAVLSLHNEIASEIVRVVAAPVTPREKQQLASVRELDPEVYEAYLQGRYFVQQGRPDALQKARDSFERALKLDGSFAPAYAGLAEVFGLQAYLFGDPVVFALEQERAARRAIDLDPSIGGAHALLGDVLRYYKWDWKGAEIEYRRGVDLAPNDATVRRKYWALLASLGRFREAAEQLEIAQRLDPLSAAAPTDMSLQAILEGDRRGAMQEIKRALDLDPQLPWAHAIHWYLLHEDGGLAEERDSALAAYLRGMGQPSVADQFLAEAASKPYQVRLREAGFELERRSRSGRVSVGLGTALLVAAGEFDVAEEWLKRAYKQRSPELVWLAQDFSWQELRDRPAVLQMLDEMGLRHVPVGKVGKN
jgi:serine/threonine protein kinase/Tfp pilus assembly protein PilF